jgi:hypothetical protein
MPAVACPDSGHLDNKPYLFFLTFFTSLRDILSFLWSNTLLLDNSAIRRPAGSLITAAKRASDNDI